MRLRRGQEVDIAVRKDRIMDLRASGWSYRAIAKEMNCSVGTVFNDYTAAMDELRESTRESADQIRSMELQRLDRMLLALEPEAMAGSPKCIEVSLKISERRAKLLGLDSPEVTMNVGEVSPDRAAQLVREKFGDHASRKSAFDADTSGETDA